MRNSGAAKSTTLVSFSGIDGAGKSTQIAELCVDLLDAGRRVDLLSFWDDVATFKHLRECAARSAFGGDNGTGSPEMPIRRRDKDVQTWSMTFIRLAIYFADAISLRRVVKKVRHSGTDIVIFDRYIDDELVNLNLRNWFTRLYARFILKLSPRPDIAILLDADPVEARARKPEYPLEFIRANRDAYLNFARTAPGVTVIPPLPLEQVKAKVANCIAANATTQGIKITRVPPPTLREDTPA